MHWNTGLSAVIHFYSCSHQVYSSFSKSLVCYFATFFQTVIIKVHRQFVKRRHNWIGSLFLMANIKRKNTWVYQFKQDCLQIVMKIFVTLLFFCGQLWPLHLWNLRKGKTNRCLTHHKVYEQGRHGFAHQTSEYLKVYTSFWIPNIFVMRTEVHNWLLEVNTKINSVLPQNFPECPCQS